MLVLDNRYYSKADSLLKSATINTLFAQSVVNQNVAGSIYVDDNIFPNTFYIVHPYGMSLLLGDTNHEKFNEELFNYATNMNKTRVKNEWLQVFPNKWNHKFEEIVGSFLIKKEITTHNHKPSTIENNNKVIEYTRTNFVFNINKFERLKQKLNLQRGYEINTTNEFIYQNMPGSVIPKYFWDSKEAFNEHGIGFSLIYQGEIAATAFSAYIVDQYLELGIETLEKYYGKDLAVYVSSLLIDYCLEHGFEPVWSCRSDNIGSYKLAQKLGFEPTISIPYYQLVTSQS